MRRLPIPARPSTPPWFRGKKIAAQPPLSVTMTKLTVNRLAHALDDLTSHMDVDQFVLARLTEDHKEGVEAFLARRKPAV
jgi:enoyl-CoA hydratase